MKYAGIIENDFSAAPGVCVTFFTQGCPHHCKGCHNPETWDFEGGEKYTRFVTQRILNAINANGIQRDFCIMGGEPLCKENVVLVAPLIKIVKEHFPDIKIYVWTGYSYYILDELKEFDGDLEYILKNIDCLIDGKYEEDQRDVTLKMRGSTNQRILYLKNGEIYEQE